MPEVKSDEVESSRREAGWFDTTHWSVVRRASQPGAPGADAALARLCQTYWYPLYVFIRRQEKSPEDAQDLVQGFFARLLENNYVKDVDREKGRFRSFLLIALKGFMHNEWDREHRMKRGGGQAVISLDKERTESSYMAEPADEMSPDKAYDRQWARTLLAQVLDRLEAESSASGKSDLFAELKIFLSGEKSKSSYSEIGPRLGMSEANVKVTVHRLRRRYRELLRMEIANTVESPEAIDDEIRDLFAAFG